MKCVLVTNQVKKNERGKLYYVICLYLGSQLERAKCLTGELISAGCSFLYTVIAFLCLCCAGCLLTLEEEGQHLSACTKSLLV